MNRSVSALFVLIAAMPFAGCGQSGPLYLPGDPSAIETPPPSPAPAVEEDEDNAGNSR